MNNFRRVRRSSGELRSTQYRALLPNRSVSVVRSCKKLLGAELQWNNHVPSCVILSQLFERILDSEQARFFSQNLQGLKQWRSILAAAYGYADRLEHLSGFEAKLLGSGAQSLIQGIVFEIHLGKNGLCLLEGLLCHGSIAFLRNQFGRIIGQQLIDKEKICGGQDVTQQLDSFADQGSNLQHSFRLDFETNFAHHRQQFLAQILNWQSADVLGVQPNGLGIEGLFRSGRGILEIDHCVGAVDAFEREGLDQFLNAHVLAIVLWRPAQQAEEIDESFWQETGVTVGGHTDHGSVTSLRELGSVGGDQQGQVRELRRSVPCGLEDEHVLEGVAEMVLTADDVSDAQLGVVGA